mgnify:CR=1 FL=1
MIFGMPGAYTSICSSAHLPSWIRTADAFRAKGVDELVVVVANDVRVTEHWGRTSGATEKGIMILADWNSELTKALGLEFSNPAVGVQGSYAALRDLLGRWRGNGPSDGN